MTLEQLSKYQPQGTDSITKREFYDQVRALSNRSFINTPKDDIHGEYAKGTYVPINVHITDNSDVDSVDVSNNSSLQTSRGLVQTLKISVIPVFYELYQLGDECDSLLRQLEPTLSTNNLVSNCITFLQTASQNISDINGIENAISTLSNANDKSAVLRALIKLYNNASKRNYTKSI